MDDFLPFDDYMASADFRLDEDRDSFSCQTCDSLTPAVIEGRFCSDCTGENRQGFLDTRVARLARENAA
jgi:Zn finger protein HypA/HybF involved in hydrogenase expression